jgi:hypothetical protein
MKKLFTKIFILVFLIGMVFSPLYKTNAQNAEPFFGYSTLKFNGSTQTRAQFSIFLDNRKSELSSVSDVFFIITDEQNNVISTKGTLDAELNAVFVNQNNSYPQNITTNSIFISDLKENTSYKASMAVKFKLNAQQFLERDKRIYINGLCEEKKNETDQTGLVLPCQKIGNEISFKTGSKETPTQGEVEERNVVAKDYPSSFDFDCGWDNFTGCFAGLLYHSIFTPLASITEFVAGILDFFIYYSTNSSSYSGEFIGIAWGAVRDIANLFFIIALLYAAIQTIMGLGAGKKVIANIVIIALLINFSLFVSQAVIDSSNILAKVFYNNMDAKDSKGNEVKKNGEKSITLALVSMFNPQKIFAGTAYQGNEGSFIFVLFISIALLIYMIYLFFSVALLFLARVVSLWIYMVFSPIAFASYTVPFDIPGFGHKEWWKNLLENAFLAPIFIFMLYVILLFKPAFSSIPEMISSGSGLMDTMMSVVIPFAMIFILLMQAKKLAVKYSGEMGAAISKAGALVGGLALGGALGGVALAGRSTLGRLGNYAANSETFKKWETQGNFLQKGAGKFLNRTGEKLSTGSFDVRGASIAGKTLASTTGLSLGKAQEGGYEKIRADQKKKREDRARKLEVGQDETLSREKRKAELEVSEAERNQNDAEIKRLKKEKEKKEKELKTKEREIKDAVERGDSGEAQRLRGLRDTVIGEIDIIDTEIKTEEKGVKDAKDKLTKAIDAINTENVKRMKGYADTISSGWNKVQRGAWTVLQHSNTGANLTADEIRIRAGKQEAKQNNS